MRLYARLRFASDLERINYFSINGTSTVWSLRSLVHIIMFSYSTTAKMNAVDTRPIHVALSFVCLVGWFLYVLVSYKVISRTGPKTERLTILRAATHETELGDHDFCLSRSHYTDTDRPVGSGWPQRESNPGPPHQESSAVSTELPRPRCVEHDLMSAAGKECGKLTFRSYCF